MLTQVLRPMLPQIEDPALRLDDFRQIIRKSEVFSPLLCVINQLVVFNCVLEVTILPFEVNMV